MRIAKRMGATALAFAISGAAWAAGTSGTTSPSSATGATGSTGAMSRSCDQLTLSAQDLTSCRSQFNAAADTAAKQRVIASFATKQTNQDAMRRDPNDTTRGTLPESPTRTSPDGMGGSSGTMGGTGAPSPGTTSPNRVPPNGGAVTP